MSYSIMDDLRDPRAECIVAIKEQLVENVEQDIWAWLESHYYATTDKEMQAIEELTEELSYKLKKAIKEIKI